MYALKFAGGRLMIPAAAPRRRPTEGGYARGEETRLRIIETAIPMFGRRGFDGVSTREIAAEAGVNPPALQYYFDSKEGLFRACGEHMAEQVAAAVEPIVARAERLLADGAPAPALIEAFCAIQEAMAELLFGEAETSGWTSFFAMDQAGFGPGIALSLLRERFVDRLQDVCAGLIGRLTGKGAEEAETRLRSFAIDGQLKIFCLGRSAALECLGWDSFSPEHARLIKSIVVEQTRTLLTSLAAKA
jgi:AcrR family transcriptional regulator